MQYEIYAPIPERRFVLDPWHNKAGMGHVADTNICWWQGKLWAIFEGNTFNTGNSSTNRIIYTTTSSDMGDTWTTPIPAFTDAAYSNNFVTPYSNYQQPSLVVVGEELWCCWFGSYGQISKLKTPTSKWTHYRVTWDMPGNVPWLDVNNPNFPTLPSHGQRFAEYEGITNLIPSMVSSPIILNDGRVAIPAVLYSGVEAAGFPKSPYYSTGDFEGFTKFPVVLYAPPNDGTQLSMSAIIGPEKWGKWGYNYTGWEPTLVQDPSGLITMFIRNTTYLGEFDEDQYLYTQSTDNGATFGTVGSTGLMVPSQRSEAIRLSETRWGLAHADAPMQMTQRGNNFDPPDPRRNVSLYLSRRGNNDFVPGICGTRDNPGNATYPSLTVAPDGTIIVAYSSVDNTVSGSHTESMKMFRLPPMEDDKAYIAPRGNLEGHFPALVAGTPPYFDFDGRSKAVSWASVGTGTFATASFSASGTWTCPVGVTSVTVGVWGAGRAGQAGSPSAGGNGGRGGDRVTNTLTVVPGTVYNFVVGVGSSDPSIPGADSWFGSPSTLLAKGGDSLSANIGIGVHTGGAGGAGSSNAGGGGGQSGGTASNGQAGFPAAGSTGGAGGNNISNAGPGGRGGNTDNVGQNGFVQGGGGGGGGTGAASPAGGSGATGTIFLTWTPPGVFNRTFAAWLRTESNEDQVLIDPRTDHQSGTSPMFDVGGLWMGDIHFAHGQRPTPGTPTFVATALDTAAMTVTHYRNAGGSSFSTVTQNYNTFVLAGPPSDGDTVTIDGRTYTFRNNPALADDVQIAPAVGLLLAAPIGTIMNLAEKAITHGVYVDVTVWPGQVANLATQSVRVVVARTDFAAISLSWVSTQITTSALTPSTAQAFFGQEAIQQQFRPYAGRPQYNGRMYSAWTFLDASVVSDLKTYYNAHAAAFGYSAMSGATTPTRDPTVVFDATGFDPLTVQVTRVQPLYELLDSETLRLYQDGSAAVELPYGTTKFTMRCRLNAVPTHDQTYVLAMFGALRGLLYLYVPGTDPTGLYLGTKRVATVSDVTAWFDIDVLVGTNKVHINDIENFYLGKPRCWLGDGYATPIVGDVTQWIDYDVSGMVATMASRGDA